MLYHYIHYLFGCNKKCCYDIFIFEIHLEFHNFNLSKIYDRTTSSSEPEQVRFSSGEENKAIWKQYRLSSWYQPKNGNFDIAWRSLLVEYLLPLLTIYQNSLRKEIRNLQMLDRKLRCCALSKRTTCISSKAHVHSHSRGLEHLGKKHIWRDRTP